jgi:thiamine pyrophosphokinase
MHVAIVAGSSLNTGLEAEHLDEADLLIAVDGGADAVAAAGRVPSVLIGDMDSISAATRRDLEARKVEVVLLEAAKDETDTEAALRFAVERGADEITVYGALGGPRVDHLVGNLLLLSSPWLANVAVRMVDATHEVFLVKGDVVFRGRKGDIISLLPLTPRVFNVHTTGLLYPLAGEPLLQSATRGVSNEMLGPEARVTHGEGVLLLIHYRERRGT